MRFKIQMSVFHVLRLFVVIFLPKKYLYRFYRSHMEVNKAHELLFGDKEIGHDIATARNMVYHTFTGYLAFPLFVAAGIISSLIGWDVVLYWKDGTIRFVIILAIAVLTGVGLFKSTKVIDDPQVYLSYFKGFQKQDGEWLRKWKRYTILLFVGSLLSLAIGIGFVFYSFMHT